MKVKTLMRTAAVLLACLPVLACQDIFTFSPFSFLQRDPKNLSAEQRLTLARDALASGDRKEMADAYAAIEADARTSTDPEVKLLAASMALELSGVPDLFYDLLGGEIDFTDTDNIVDDLDAFLLSVQASYVEDAAGFFQAVADGDSALLGGDDYLLGAACLLFTAAVDPTNGTVTALDQTDVADALAFVQTGLAVLDPETSAYSMLEELETLLSDSSIFP